MEDDVKPEIGDTVEFNEHEYFDQADGMNKRSSDRGEIIKVFKNGSIKVKPTNSQTAVKLQPLEFFVLSKAG